jgi:hypothetical protein
MKCEIEYQNFKYFVLEQVEQLEHHKKPAFEALLKAARSSPVQTAYVGGKSINMHGAILGSHLEDAQQVIPADSAKAAILLHR